MTSPDRALAVAYAGRGREWLKTVLALDDRLAELARRPGDPGLTRVRLMWWEEAVAGLGAGPPPVDPILLALQPLVAERAERSGLIAALVRAWDEVAGQASPDPAGVEALAKARGLLLADGSETGALVKALSGRALAETGGKPEASVRWLREGLATRWPRALRGQRLLARAALHRLEGKSERALALRLVGWGLSGR